MTTFYPGNPADWPASFPLLSDHTPPDAATFNIPLEALGDRTAYLRTRLDDTMFRTGLLEPLNWTHSATSIGDLRFAHFDPFRRVWLAGGGARNLRGSFDFGRTWTPTNMLSFVGGATDECSGADSDDAGKVVVAALTKDVFVFDGSNWSRKAGVHASSEDAFAASVVYSPVHGLWCASAIFNVDGVQIATASDPTGSWAARPAPTGMDTFVTVRRSAMAIDRATGLIVLALADADADEILVAYSIEGGMSWSEPVSLSLDFDALLNPVIDVSVTFNAATGTWLAVVTKHSNTATAALSAVFRSADGTSWAKVAMLSSHELVRPAPCGRHWVATAKPLSGAPEIVLSVDDGVSWSRVGIALEGTDARGVYPGAGGLIALSETNTYASLRTGAPNLGVLT